MCMLMPSQPILWAAKTLYFRLVRPCVRAGVHTAHMHSPFGLLSACSCVVTLLPVLMRSVHDCPDSRVICQMRQSYI